MSSSEGYLPSATAHMYISGDEEVSRSRYLTFPTTPTMVKNHGSPLSSGRPNFTRCPMGTSVRKIASYKGIIHNCNWFSVIDVVVVEKPSSQQRDPHGLEISSTYNPLGSIQNFVRQERAPFDGKEHIPAADRRLEDWL